MNPAILGVAFAVFSLLSALGSQLGKRLMAHLDILVMMRFMLCACGTTAVGLLVIPGPAVLVAALPLQLVFGMGMPLARTVLAARSPAALRATVLSFQDLTMGFALLLSSVGGALLLDIVSPAAMAVASSVLIIATLATSAGRPLRHRADAPPNTQVAAVGMIGAVGVDDPLSTT